MDPIQEQSPEIESIADVRPLLLHDVTVEVVGKGLTFHGWIQHVDSKRGQFTLCPDEKFVLAKVFKLYEEDRFIITDRGETDLRET